MREEIHPRDALIVRLVFHDTTKGRGNPASAMTRQHEDTTQPWAEIFAAFEIELSERRRSQRRITVMRNPRDRQLVAVQMRFEFRGPFSRSLLRENVRPMLEEARDQLRRQLWSFCEVADAHRQ